MPLPSPESYIHPNVEKRWINQQLQYGLFAKAPIRAGEVVLRDGGRILSKEEYLQLSSACREFPYQIDSSSILAPESCDSVPDEWLANHSCDPTVVYKEPYTWVALRDISAGEEITCDYATTWTEDTEDEEMECFCNAKNCRKKWTSRDWMLPELQKRLKGFFTKGVQNKIDSQAP
ncbi:MAG: SET domain-containing protein [Candidatus Wildermuthbacteria bacterium]|nr:SET domain-containing protein [Candidatus Wildermuthbacteria bacterium]